MGALKEQPRFTVQQYLALERAALDRSEFVDGVIHAMAGESLSHGRITTNLTALIATQLKGRTCEVFVKDTKVRSGPEPVSRNVGKGRYSYPDLVVVCGPIEHHDARKDIILNPTAIIEVLSESTENRDRVDKMNRFRRWNPSLRDYVLVSQLEPLIERFTRIPGEAKWEYEVIEGLDAVVEIPSIDCRLSLRDVYDRVEFPESEPDSE